MTEIQERINILAKEYKDKFSKNEVNDIMKDEMNEIVHEILDFFEQRTQDKIKVATEVFCHSKDEQLIAEQFIQIEGLAIVRKAVTETFTNLHINPTKKS